MCGIFGSICLNGTPNEDAGLVAQGVRLLRHRGPDGYGIETRGGVCFGHARLSIIDLAGGKQPMMTGDGRGILTYNGEVYNFSDIKKELEALGHSFQTSSDTEVVLHAYLEWGNSCLEKFRGMFAFACADLGRRRVLLARDRIGKKPLFYTRRRDTLYFSSELEALYQVIGPFPVDMEAVDDCLSWQYIPAPRTIYRNVICLPPAHFVEMDLQTGRENGRRYWDLKFREDSSLTAEDWGARIDDGIREAVKVRLVSDVPFGAFLSGGIDSSLVVGYMSELMSMPVKTFSIGFKNADFSELEFANAVAGICRTEHETQIVETDSLAILPILVRHFGQPFADSSAIPTYYVSRMAREKVKMILSGDGGDENFAGYNTYESILSRLNGCPPRWTNWKERVRVLASSWYQRWQNWSGRSALMDRVYEMQAGLYQHFSPLQRKALYLPKWAGIVRDRSAERRALLDCDGAPLVSRLQYLDIKTYLPYDILTKVDITSMANSLEVRAPLLDHRLMETAATMPAEFKLRKELIDGRWRYEKKYTLKKLALQRYPGAVVDRPKKGFGIPLGDWFAGSLREKVSEMLLHSDFLPIFFRMEQVEKIIRNHSPRTDKSHQLWNLLFLDEWMRQHEAALPSA